MVLKLLVKLASWQWIANFYTDPPCQAASQHKAVVKALLNKVQRIASKASQKEKKGTGIDSQNESQKITSQMKNAHELFYT